MARNEAILTTLRIIGGVNEDFRFFKGVKN